MENAFKLHVSYLNNENISRSEEIVLDDKSPICKQLHEKINQTFGLSLADYKLYFGLKVLEYDPEQELKELGLRSGNRLHAIQKKVPPAKPDVPKVELREILNASYGLVSMIQHDGRYHRSRAITKLLEDKEEMEKIMSSIPGLKEDRTAMDILSNPKLFKVVVNPKYVKTVVEKHPCLAAAFKAIWNTLTTSSQYSSASPSTSNPMSMEVEQQYSSPPSGSQSSSSNPISNMITLSQLSAAIAQATPPSEGYSFPYSAFNTPSSNTDQSNSTATTTTPQTRTSSNQSQARPQPITPEVLNQAMQEALMSTGLREVSESLQSEGATSGNTNSAVSEDVMQSGLEQLHAMGITDDEASRQALTATQGNVEAAINILFGGS